METLVVPVPLFCGIQSSFAQNFNRYSDVLNNPLKYIDPDGYQTRYVRDWDPSGSTPPPCHGGFGWGNYSNNFGGPNGSGFSNFGNPFSMGGDAWVRNYGMLTYRQAQNLGFWNQVDAIIFSGPRSNPYETFRGFHFSDGSAWYTEDGDNNFAANGGGESWLGKAWNSNFARYHTPDVIYINVSGVLTFLGGGGADIGIALPLRGKSAGKVHLYSTLKGKGGLNLGVSVNIGRSNYLGPVNLFDFETTFGGKSSGVEVDFLFGTSISVSETDQHGNSLFSFDVGVGPGIGGSVDIGATTYIYSLFRIW